MGGNLHLVMGKVAGVEAKLRVIESLGDIGEVRRVLGECTRTLESIRGRCQRVEEELGHQATMYSLIKGKMEEFERQWVEKQRASNLVSAQITKVGQNCQRCQQ